MSAWVSKKVYAILSKSEEGKDIIERLPDLSQDEASKEIDAFFGNGGKGASLSKEYGQAKFDDEVEEERYKAIGDEEVSEKDYEDDENFEPTIDNIMKRSKEITDAFEMPAEDGWKETSFGEKSFIKNEGKDNEAFIQYNGSDYDGSNQEYVAGYMENGEYITQEFSNLEEAKDFINNMPESKQDELDDNVANKPQENKKPLDSYKQLRNTIKKYKNNEQDIKRTIKELSDIFGNNESIIEYLLGVVDKY